MTSLDRDPIPYSTVWADGTYAEALQMYNEGIHPDVIARSIATALAEISTGISYDFIDHVSEQRRAQFTVARMKWTMRGADCMREIVIGHLGPALLILQEACEDAQDEREERLKHQPSTWPHEREAVAEAEAIIKEHQGR
jgi:hypothetical protein